MGLTPEDFFRTSPSMRRVLVPVLIAFAGSCVFFIQDWSLGQIIFWSALAVPALLYAAVLVWPDRTRWASRAVAGAVGLMYLAYLIDEIFFEKGPIGIGGSTGDATPWNAYLGFTIIGVPCLIYAVRGRSGRLGDPRQASSGITGADLPPTDRIGSGNTDTF